MLTASTSNQFIKQYNHFYKQLFLLVVSSRNLNPSRFITSSSTCSNYNSDPEKTQEQQLVQNQDPLLQQQQQQSQRKGRNRINPAQLNQFFNRPLTNIQICQRASKCTTFETLWQLLQSCREPLTLEQLVDVLLRCEFIKKKTQKNPSDALLQGLKQGVYAWWTQDEHSDVDVKMLTQVLHACGKLGVSNDDILVKYALDLLSSSYLLSKAKSSDLIRAICAVQLLQLEDLQLIFILLTEMSRADRMVETNNASIVRLMDAVAGIRFAHEEIFTPVLHREVASPSRRSSYTPAEISSILQSLSVLRYRDEHLLEGLSLTLTNPKKLQKFEGKDFGLSLQCFGQLQYENEDMLQQLKDEYWRRVEQADAPTLCRSLWGLAVLGNLSPEEFVLGCQRLRKIEQEDGGVIEGDELVMFYMSYIGMHSENHVDVDGMRALLSLQDVYYLKEVRQRVLEMQDMTGSGGLTGMSHAIEVISSELIDFNIEHECNVPIADGLVTANIVLRDFPVVIEMEAYTSYTFNGPHKRLGRRTMKNKIMKALGYQVVSIPFFECDMRKDLFVNTGPYLQLKLQILGINTY